MLYTVGDAASYCYTGTRDPGTRDARPLAPDQGGTARPTAVFIHGALQDHSVWQLQSRYFASHGFDVLAVDLPAHGRSMGAALPSIEALALWLLALLDAAGVRRAMLIGHSMGALVALEAAAMAPPRVSRLALLGACLPMTVSEVLLNMARDDEAGAIELMTLWAHHTGGGPSVFPGPGASQLNHARRLQHRIAESYHSYLLHTDMAACNAYSNGVPAAVSVSCPTLFLFGRYDQMTPPKATGPLTANVPHARVIDIDSGHMLMTERPDAVREALYSFATAPQTAAPFEMMGL
jgi:pimeloyl-ACP methyl ester carboxylesterase